MADVLGALEHAEREAGEEIASRQQTGGRPERESGVFFQKVGHFVQLRYLVGVEDPVILQHLERVPVLHAKVFGHQVQHVVEHGDPSAQLVRRVLDVRDRVAAVIANRPMSKVNTFMGGGGETYNLYSKAMLAISFLRARYTLSANPGWFMSSSGSYLVIR